MPRTNFVEVGIDLPSDVHKRLKSMRKETNTTITQIVRRLLREDMEAL